MHTHTCMCAYHLENCEESTREMILILRVEDAQSIQTVTPLCSQTFYGTLPCISQHHSERWKGRHIVQIPGNPFPWSLPLLMTDVHQLPAPWPTPWATPSFVYFSQSLPPFLFVHVKATLYLNRSSLPLVSMGPPWKAIHNSASDALPLICTPSSLKCLGLDPLSPHPFQSVLAEAPKLMYSRTPAEAGHKKGNSDISFPQAEWLSALWKPSQLLLFRTKSRVPD